MKNRVTFLFCNPLFTLFGFFCCLTSLVHSQSNLTIDASNSPYYILTDTTIALGDTVLFGPGALVLMGNLVDVQVEGVLKIQGLPNNLATIKPINPGIGWGEFRILHYVDSLIIENAYVEDGRFYSLSTINYFNNVEFVNNQNLLWNEAISRFYKGELKIENCKVYGTNKGEGFLVHFINNPQVLNSYFNSIPDAVEYLNCNNGRVGNCQFFDMVDDAIDLNNCYRTLIDSNLIVNVENRGMEIGSENLGSSSEIFVHRNVLVNCAEGVNFKEGSDGLIMNNTFYNNRKGVTSLADGRPNIGSNINIVNCIFNNNNTPIFNDALSSYTVDYSSSSSSILQGDSNLFINPRFVDPTNLDFSLKESSKCIDAGRETGALDRDGTFADLGVFYFHQDTTTSLPVQSLTGFQLMPNPVLDILTITVNELFQKAQIFNTRGQLEKEYVFSSENRKELSLDVSTLKRGVYVIVVSNSTHRIQDKIVKL